VRESALVRGRIGKEARIRAREGVGYFLKPLFGNEEHRGVGVHRLRALPDGDRPVPGAPVEDGLCHDEIEQRYPRIGDDGYGLILLICWHIDLVLLEGRYRDNCLIAAGPASNRLPT
jgi:hypothetical protein